MKKLKDSVLALGAMISSLVAHPGDALGQGICTTNYIVTPSTMDCQTSLSEHATGLVEVNGPGTSRMIVVFRQGQESAQGILLRPGGGMSCFGPVITARNRPEEITCLNGTTSNFFRIVVN